MRLFQSLPVGIVLAVLMCAPARASQPIVTPLVWNASAEETKLVLPRTYPVQRDVVSQNLKLVYDIASKFGYPEVLQGILLQETSGGAIRSLVGSPHAPVSKRSYGLMQVQTVAARSMFMRYPELLDKYYPNRTVKSITDKELIKLLMTNNEANVTIATYHYSLYFNMLGNNHTTTIAAYNVGIGGVKKLRNPAQFKYVREVKQKIESVVKPFNRKYNL